ncbi:MAG: histidinol dehydrogenase, partial [Nitrosospira sp.]|nr:histidinol dehydrogenase [Nitrosospira sp.]
MSEWICGVDESGRGPLAGPVFAACVILDPQHRIEGLADSKTLTKAQRDALTVAIKTHSLAWAIGIASVREIDCLNILQASLLAMKREVSEDVDQAVRAILADVAERGDAALVDFTARFDRLSLTPQTLRIAPGEIEAAL